MSEYKFTLTKEQGKVISGKPNYIESSQQFDISAFIQGMGPIADRGRQRVVGIVDLKNDKAYKHAQKEIEDVLTAVMKAFPEGSKLELRVEVPE